jgi:hypothetical protein
MDAVICVGLAIIECFVLQTLGHRTLSDKPTSLFLAIFLSQYLILKFYRTFIYHKYVSPFRYLPGPAVSKDRRSSQTVTEYE